MGKKRILLIASGGTIASVQTDAGYQPLIDAADLLTYLPDLDKQIDVDPIQLMNLDSSNIQACHWLEMAKTIEDHYEDYDGFVICHGTDTMAFTAAALSYLIQESRKPIILTGAQQPINLINTDARINLKDSLTMAAHPRAHDVNIVFNGKVICGTRAQKVKTHSYDAFVSINFPIIAQIQSSRVFLYLDDINKVEQDPIFYHNLDESVGLFKLAPSMRAESLTKLAQDYRALVIEGYGLGGLPVYPKSNFRQAVGQLIEAGKLVVMTTQVPLEGSDMSVYEVGKRAKEAYGLVEAFDMTLPAVLTKLMWALGQSSDRKQVLALFKKLINRDSLWRAE